MINDFINKIEIANYKCLNGLNVDKFQRVNLIGGENNVGKTAFLEVCYLISSANRLNNFLFSLMMIERNRDKLNICISDDINIADILKNNTYIEIASINNIKYEVKEVNFNSLIEVTLNNTTVTIDFKDKISFEKSDKILFIDNLGFSNSEFKDIYKAAQFKDKDMQINEFLKNFNFENPKFKIIDDKPYLKTNDHGEYKQLNNFGDGVKHYISIICSLYFCEDGYLFIDEIENGIHYKLYDKLWEIILTTSREVNTQVFITTHSKECIESYNRVSGKLNIKEAMYFEMGKNKNNDNIFMRNLDNKQLEYELTHQGRYRGE